MAPPSKAGNSISPSQKSKSKLTPKPEGATPRGGGSASAVSNTSSPDLPLPFKVPSPTMPAEQLATHEQDLLDLVPADHPNAVVGQGGDAIPRSVSVNEPLPNTFIATPVRSPVNGSSPINGSRRSLDNKKESSIPRSTNKIGGSVGSVKGSQGRLPVGSVSGIPVLVAAPGTGSKEVVGNYTSAIQPFEIPSMVSPTSEGSLTQSTNKPPTPTTATAPLISTSPRPGSPGSIPSAPSLPPLPSDFPSQPAHFAVSPRDLAKIVDFDKRNDTDWIRQTFWAESGGPEGVAAMLRTDLVKGLECKAARPKESTKEIQMGPLTKLFARLKPAARVAPSSSEAEQQTTNNNTNNTNMIPVDRKLRLAHFGTNRVPPPPPPSLFSLIIGTIREDVIVRILLFGAAVILVIGTATHPATGWYEGVAIFAAVCIVLGVTSLNDWIKEGKFRKMAELKNDKTIKVLRAGHPQTISTYGLLAGDLVLLSVGDEIPGDGFLVSSSRLSCDESPLTGEPIAVKKDASAPFVFGGTFVGEGEGTMCVTAVGKYSMGGQIQELLFRGSKRSANPDDMPEEEDDEGDQTPLQRRLKGVALAIGKLGFSAGLVTFLALAIRWGVVVGQHIAAGGQWDYALLLDLVNFFVVGVTVIVVAVPEGLPLAVTISLAFSMFRMVRDRCFVRHLDASETMGEATCICTDKTGTLTENRMTVVSVLCAGSEADVEKEGTGAVPEVARDLLGEAIAINSTAFLKPATITPDGRPGPPEFVGSATEGALLVFAGKLGYEYETLRESNEKAEDGVWPFSSKRKRMATLIVRDIGGRKGYRLHVKGASEIVLGLCDRALGKDGKVGPLGSTEKKNIETKIKEWASEGLRTLILAYRDVAEIPRLDRRSDDADGYNNPIECNLVFLTLVGIKDPLRKEVPAAVKACQNAGMVVRMVTGDNVLTATKIATECGILDPKQGHLAVEGPVFRSLSDAERRELIPNMRVLARSSPTDKFVLVSLLRSMGETVAVTGDGTNDAAALNEADVGFAMGISGTQIAMNASDIVLTDDNFSSIVNAVRWGRNVYDGIRKFLQFQLSVNVVAILFTIVGSVAYGRAPLNSVQLLWVNLIMDSLGALALASDKPDDSIMEQKPHSRHESMVSKWMWFYMTSIVTYELAILIAMLFVGESMVPFPAEEALICTFDTSLLPAGAIWLDSCRGRWRLTAVFTTFILLQVFNQITTRQLEGEINPLRGLLRNKTFVFINIVIVGVQILVVQFGGGFVGTVALDWEQWLICAAWASGLVLWVVGIRLAAKLYTAMPATRRTHKKVAVEHHPVGTPAAHLKPVQPSWVGEMESIKSTSRIFVKSKSSVALHGQQPGLPSTRRIVPEGDSIVEIPQPTTKKNHKDEHVTFQLEEDHNVGSGKLNRSKANLKKSIEELASKVFSDEAVASLRNKKSLSRSGIPLFLSKKDGRSGSLGGLGTRESVARDGGADLVDEQPPWDEEIGVGDRS